MAMLIKNYIGGDWMPARTMEATPVYNPSRGEVIAEVPAGGTEEVNQAVAAARAAFPAWSEIPVVERARAQEAAEDEDVVDQGGAGGLGRRLGHRSNRRRSCRPGGGPARPRAP